MYKYLCFNAVLLKPMENTVAMVTVEYNYLVIYYFLSTKTCIGKCYNDKPDLSVPSLSGLNSAIFSAFFTVCF